MLLLHYIAAGHINLITYMYIAAKLQTMTFTCCVRFLDLSKTFIYIIIPPLPVCLISKGMFVVVVVVVLVFCLILFCFVFCLFVCFLLLFCFVFCCFGVLFAFCLFVCLFVCFTFRGFVDFYSVEIVCCWREITRAFNVTALIHFALCLVSSIHQ